MVTQCILCLLRMVTFNGIDNIIVSAQDFLILPLTANATGAAGQYAHCGGASDARDQRRALLHTWQNEKLDPWH